MLLLHFLAKNVYCDQVKAVDIVFSVITIFVIFGYQKNIRKLFEDEFLNSFLNCSYVFYDDNHD